MSQSLDRLYELLPAVYRMRDAEQGYQLRALLRVIAEQVNIVEDDIAQLYENWFIETCEDWVVPYLGDLINYRFAHAAGEPGDASTAQALQRSRILTPRRDVAATIGNRRRKGTIWLLELLASNVAGYPALVSEFYKLLGVTQHVNHAQTLRGRTVDLRQGDALDLINSPFDSLAHTIDVRRSNSSRTPGRYNIPSLGVSVWRLKTYSVTHAPAHSLDVGSSKYTFSTLGHDTMLYNHPQPETEPTHIAEELNLPVPIRRRAFEERVEGKGQGQASANYYGVGAGDVGQSIAIWMPGWSGKGDDQLIPREAIIPADLSDWKYSVPAKHVAVDTQLGRIIFPSKMSPKGVRVSYHYAFSADMGGGEYNRPISQPEKAALYLVRKGVGNTYSTIGQALAQWQEDKETGATESLAAVIEIGDSEVYREGLQIELKQNENLQLRAANRTRPIIKIPDSTEDTDAFTISGESGSRLILDGLIVAERSVLIQKTEHQDEEAADNGDLCDVTIRHCTFVPGWGFDNDCNPKTTLPSLQLKNTRAHIKIEHSIVGAIEVESNEVINEAIRLNISDSIIAATGNDLAAIDSPKTQIAIAYVSLNIARSTVIGKVDVHAIESADNCIFYGKVRVARRQIGCVRFSYVPDDSRTPRRYQCQPDLVIRGLNEEDKARETLRVRPQFNSTRYGTPTYCQLSTACANEIKRGADDESEMGVFHDLYQPQRATNLDARLDEYTPAGKEAGIINVS